MPPMTVDPNVALGILTTVAVVTVFIMERIARSNSLARDAISRIDTHEKVCAERQRRIEEHLKSINSKLDRRRTARD